MSSAFRSNSSADTRSAGQPVSRIGRGQLVVLVEQPLIKAQTKDFVRQTQERLIGGPILQRCTTHGKVVSPGLRRGAGELQHAVHAAGHHPVPLLGWRVQCRSEEHDPGVFDDRVHPAKLGDRWRTAPTVQPVRDE